MTLPTSALTTTTVAPTSVATTAITVATSAATTGGLSSVTSALSSAASTQAQASPGFSAQISAWVSSVINAIRDCLAKLPLVGQFFSREAVTTAATTASTSTTAASTTWTDAELVNMIKGQFVAAPTTSTVTAPAVPAADVVAYCLNLFGQIGTADAKAEAFQAVLVAVNSTDDIARQFYGALDAGLQTSFREQIWIANGRNDDGHGMQYGEHMIATAIRGPLAHAAVAAQLAALRAASTTAASTTTVASTTVASTTAPATTVASTTTGATTGP